MTLREGDHVTGSVRLVRLLGSGGMGSVWVAHHESLDAEVAVKFVSQELAERDPSLLERFRREAAASAKLKSPHAVKTFDHGVMKDGRPYIVMELLDGETLGARLLREGKLPPAQVALVVMQVAHVLDEAHRLGVVHRDIKPDNIFLLSGGYELFVKVLDFGIAKQTTSAVATVTDTGAIVGTPEYMSPEQLLSTKSADYRADLWSLAVLAYHALTGQMPFRGETLPSLSIEICGGRFAPPSRLVDDLPQAFDDWFDRALDPEPARRFDSVLKMAELFARVARGAELGSLDTVRTPPRLSSSPSIRPTPVESADGGTLASAGIQGDLPAATPPEVGVEDAPSVDSGVRPSVPNAGPEESGRRAAVPATLVAGQSPTFAGAASTLEPTSEEERRRARIKLAAVLVAAVLAAVAVDIGLRRAEPLRETATTILVPAVLPDLPDAPRPAEPPPPPPETSASVAPETSAAPSASAPRIAVRPAPPKAAPSASAKRSGCDNPYVLRSDGTIAVKPECL